MSVPENTDEYFTPLQPLQWSLIVINLFPQKSFTPWICSFDYKWHRKLFSDHWTNEQPSSPLPFHHWFSITQPASLFPSFYLSLFPPVTCLLLLFCASACLPHRRHDCLQLLLGISEAIHEYWKQQNKQADVKGFFLLLFSKPVAVMFCIDSHQSASESQFSSHIISCLIILILWIERRERDSDKNNKNWRLQ